ncbi:MAG: hypothetical protein D6721_05670 [Gammaproteobacteria bacterium]|nr:MAG: hypothetical protein D6721_05670 [Gammaproteobacteria bacterium]
MNAACLEIELLGYWHAGGGRGAGAVLDAVVHRDPNGLPVLPGRHLKGLLRDALARAEAWDWPGVPTGSTETLFGAPAREGKGKEHPPAPSSPGCLRVSDATLPDELAHWLAGSGGKGSLPHLFRSLYATAIDHETGTARDRSLRGIEVVVPLTLFSRITPVPDREPPPDWQDRIRAVLPLIDAVGAHRTRGLGRAILRLKEVA